MISMRSPANMRVWASKNTLPMTPIRRYWIVKRVAGSGAGSWMLHGGKCRRCRYVLMGLCGVCSWTACSFLMAHISPFMIAWDVSVSLRYKLKPDEPKPRKGELIWQKDAHKLKL